MPDIEPNILAQVPDYNNDNKKDIVWRDSITGRNTMWLMNGTSIAAAADLPTLATTWENNGFGDFNGDGRTDLLWRNTATGDNTVWQMNGSSIDAAANLPTLDQSSNCANCCFGREKVKG